MIDMIKNLPADEAQKVLKHFMTVYFDKGFGVMNKTEIETLLYHVLKTNGLLTERCFDDSFALKIPEAKARKLIYESQIKYSERKPDEHYAYLRKSIGECLEHAFISKNKKEIRFAIEDKYIRVALNAKLREMHYFADTSFNSDIVSLDQEAFAKMIAMLVPNDKLDLVKANLRVEGIDVVDQNTKDEFFAEFTKELLVQESIEALKQLGVLLATLVF